MTGEDFAFFCRKVRAWMKNGNRPGSSAPCGAGALRDGETWRVSCTATLLPEARWGCCPKRLTSFRSETDVPLIYLPLPARLPLLLYVRVRTL